LDFSKRFPPRKIFAIPAKLDDCNITHREYRRLHYVDLSFTNWKKGIAKILQAIRSENISLPHSTKNNLKAPSLEEEDNGNSSKTIGITKGIKRLTLFRGEKSGFLGRQEYIDKEIKEYLKTPGSVISIIGPGGSGKSQLAFKAIRQYYEKESIFDIVIPIYFDINLMTFDEFLLKIAEKILPVSIELNEFEKATIEVGKNIIRDVLCEKTHPLIYIDNFETVSLVINDVKPKELHQLEDARQIKNFLNNDIPENTSIFFTSRERNNLGGKEKHIDLKGLDAHESRELFHMLVADEYLRNPSSEKVQKTIENLLQKTGGHPLSIEIMAKNITTVEEIEEMSERLGDKVNRDESNKRLQSLKASFDYTINKLDTNLKELLQKLTFFNSPFSIVAAEEVFDAKRLDIVNLFNRSLLTRVESDDAYGKIKEPEYWLYKFHPATKNYLEDEIAQIRGERNFYDDLEGKYGERFADAYCRLLDDTSTAIEKEDKEAPDKIRRFNIIFEGENNDFERALLFTNKSYIAAEISALLGSILNRLGIYNKALEYHKKSNDINKTLDDKAGLARDYLNIGWLFSKLHDYKQALEYHTYALNEYQQLNSKTGMAREFSYIGSALSNLGSHEQALEYHNRAIAIDRELNDDKKWLAEDYENIASTFYNMKEYNKALEYYKISLGIYNKVADRLGTLYCYSRLGRTYEAIGEHEQALDHHYKALEMRKEMGYKAGIAREYYYISFVLYNKQQKNEALESLVLAKGILEEFDRQTGYRHPMLGEVQERIYYLQSIK
jgi:tetratricopeptide (TPR) repeat protein